MSFCQTQGGWRSPLFSNQVRSLAVAEKWESDRTLFKLMNLELLSDTPRLKAGA
ncbi:hypothetical protein [Nostoc sp.]